jgi:hypothetical protein
MTAALPGAVGASGGPRQLARPDTSVTPEDSSRGASASLPTGVTGDWWSAAQQGIATAEYHATWQRLPEDTGDGAYQAPNRAQGFRTHFTDRGIRVVPRTEEQPSWQWGLELVGFGWGEDVQPVTAAEPRANANRVEYVRSGLVEWYVNEPRGLEQGFTIEQPARDVGGAGTSQVVVELALRGGLAVYPSEGGQSIEFARGDVRVVRYAELKVTDAMERPLPARMEIGSTSTNDPLVRIVVEAGEAAWPIKVDPLATTPSWTAESNQASAYFGTSVASAGDVNGDGYGDVIVGAPGYDNGETSEGRAFVFHGSASGLSATAAWSFEGAQAEASLGVSVASAGDVNGDGYADVIVGADLYSNGQPYEGRAFVYHGSAAGLSVTANGTVESNQALAYFGNSVASAGDVNSDGYADVIVGAYLYDNIESDEGRAFVYHGSAAGLSSTANWIAESDQASAGFGSCVAAAGDVNGDGYADVIVGAPAYENVETDEGRTSVYYGSAAGLSAFATWTAESNQASAAFGSSVASAGDVNGDGYADVIVGASGYDNGQSNEGRAVVYHGSAGGLSANAGWIAEGDQASARLGRPVASAGDVNGDGYCDVIVGASEFDNSETDEGRAYVYYGGASSLSATAAWTAEGNQASGFFGFSVASAGDVNGDGFADVVVGASHFDNGLVDAGCAFAYHGSASGLLAASAWTAGADQASAYFGRSVASAGDVNGDGYADVIIGAYFYDNAETNEGRTYVFHGSASGLSTSANWTAEGNQVNAYLGFSVASAGDVNGDGYADVIIGAFGCDNVEAEEGRSFVYHGSAAGLSVGAAWTAESNQANAQFGYSAASAGDVNGDGYSDAIVGAWTYDNGETDEGRAYVYHGSAAGLSASAAWTVESNQATSGFGSSVAAAGDVNGDGYGDVIVGAYAFDNGQTNEGRAFVYRGSASGLLASATWICEPDQESALFGWSVGSAGDVNGDGYVDVIVGALYCTNGESIEGCAFVYHGSASGLLAGAAWIAEGNQAYADFGISVASAGDVNGDGYADVIIGARMYDNPESNEGRAFVYYGNAGTGRRVVAQQLRGGGSTTPVQPWGLSYDADEFQVRAQHSSPFGRERVRTEIEGCPSGVRFGNAACIGGTSATWTDSTASAAGVSVTQTLSGLTLGTLYHWRERTLRAPYTVTHAGITAPPHPAHGPWRRLMGQAFEADIRTSRLFQLNVALGGSGSGTATSSPVGISCGTTLCIGVFAEPTVVTLTAVASAGSEFGGWTGEGCSGTGTCQVTMSAARSVTAVFTRVNVLTVVKTGTGSGRVSSNPSGIYCGPNCEHAYAQGTVVRLVALPDATATFAGWNGWLCGGLGDCWVEMNEALTIEAMFIARTATGFVPVTPCRLIDTRVSSGPSAGAPALDPDSRRVFSLLGKCGLVSGAKAISGNLTVVGATVEGDLRVIGGHLVSTNASSVWIPISRARANNAIVQLSVDSLQTIAVINTTAGSVHFILDINGYFL